MDKPTPAEEFGQLARLLFDSAADSWYKALAIELIVGVFATILNLLDLSGDLALAAALLSGLCLIAAYFLRLKFDKEYDDAETMRRQAVLTDGLGWPINPVQASEWRLRAGRSARERLKQAPREPDYFATHLTPGPHRLAEMTLESAFYTRHLYAKFREWIWVSFGVSVAILVLAIVIALFKVVPSSVDVVVARAVFSLIPVLLALDLFGLGLRLNRLITAVCDVEKGLDQLLATRSADVPQVLRMVAEYNCQVVAGVPIHNWLFDRWHDEIRELWQRKQATTPHQS